MQIIKITDKNFNDVKNITQTTIDSVYPKYYPAGAVQYFKNHHNDENIMSDIKDGQVYCLFENEKAVGTITIKENHINRLFVLPDFQGKGFGKELLNFAEKTIFQNYKEIEIDASFPAKSIYLKRGYKEVDFIKVEIANGDYLCYDVMLLSL